MCLLVGLFRPAILLSRGLLAVVSEGELGAIARHERAHAERRHTLARLLARICAVFMVPRSRRALFDALELAQEQSADEVGAAVLGDRLAMAGLILKMERLLHSPRSGAHALAISLGGYSVPARVAALLDHRLEKSSRLPGSLAAVIVIALLISGPELHHATETLLGYIAHR
jgi:Zn-dependent protease with chaperone function